MYLLELHGMALHDEDGRPAMRSFEKQLGGTSGFKTLAAAEGKLVELAEDVDSEWEHAFAVSKEGVAALWWRFNSEDRTGGATDLRIGYAPSDYVSKHYIRSSAKLLCCRWNGQTTLQQASVWAEAEVKKDPKLNFVVLFDLDQRRIAAAWEQPEDHKGISAELCVIAIGEHIA